MLFRSLEVIRRYWLYQASRGNKKAIALVDALMAETIDRRFDAAFGVTRTEQERDDRLSAQIQQLESDLAELGNAYTFDEFTRTELEAYRDENRRLRNVLEEQGIDAE